MNIQELWSKAACVNQDTDLFFPGRDQGPRGSDDAKEVCSACPVRRECLAFALEEDMSFGIWGGTTPAERERLK